MKKAWSPDSWRSKPVVQLPAYEDPAALAAVEDRKSTRLNSSHSQNSYAGFCLQKQPELRQAAGGVGVLGPERRPERVDLAQRQAVGLDVELPGDAQVSLPAAVIVVEVRGAPNV